MGKLIDLREFVKPTKGLEDLFTEIEKYNQYEIADRAGLETVFKDDDHLPNCLLCDKEFDYSDKIFVEKSPTFEEEPGWDYEFFCEKCFEFYLEHKFDPEVVEEAFSGWPECYCALCGQVFDHELPHTDGEKYYCEKCGPKQG